MDKSIDKEKRKSRDERESRDHHKHRHHHHNDDDEEYRSRKSRREKSRDRSEERDSRREEKSRREKSRERSEERDLRRERSEERESRRDREREKRKVRDGSEDEEDKKRVRVSESESKRERRRRFEDGDSEVKDGNKRDRRRFEDDNGEKASRLSGSIVNDGIVESQSVTTRIASETIPTNNHSVSKVSSISTTNENKGINITGSHEVNGNDKSSTNGTPATAGKIGAPSLDALALAKKTLQKQKELREKLDKMKKIPMSNKGIGASSVTGSQVGSIGGKGAVTSSSSAFPSPSTAEKPIGTMDPEKYEAVKRAQELAAKMGFRQDPEFAPLINLFPGQLPPDISVAQKPAKAPVLRLDALGREIDEHGNVVNISKPSNLSTLKVNINKQKKDAFLIEKPEFDVDPEKNPHFDPRMGIDKNKLLRPKRQNFLFVEEGKWSKDAEIIKLKSQFGEAQAKELKAKQAQLAKAKAEPNINPNLIEVAERVVTKEKKVKEPIPEVEWWDVPILSSGNYTELDDGEPVEAKLKMEKITIYVEHPEPIEPPLEAPPPPPQPLKLTKKEQKKLRTQRRLAAEKEKQEMIRQGLIEPPKAKVKMSNLMRVLGSEATQDPTRMEKEIRAAAAEREQAHVDRNIARKLTPAERREKKERKLFDDTTILETIVSVYKVNDLSHPQNRFKVDINAQENRLTGCAVIHEGFCVVVVEGGMKSIKRYGKLMLRRINWDAKLEKEDEEEDNEEDKGPNKCVLVWQGSVAKPSFNRFFVHDSSRSEGNARKVFADAGVGHYWDLAANFVDDQA